MGLLIDGKWHDSWYDTAASDGKFVRPDTVFRHTISAAPEAPFPAEKGRYHLYVSYACPWAHRALIMRRLKGLEDFISVSVVDAYMGDEGWTFGEAGTETEEHLYGLRRLQDLYVKSDPKYTGRVTVPVLWDRKTHQIVNNESSEIIRIFNSAFDSIGAKPGDYFPEAHRDEIDALNASVYDQVNNGVYKAGFATTQRAYTEAVTAVFEGLDSLEARLSTRRYLFGDRLTEADIRLVTTLFRFDKVYVGHFKCNIRQLRDYPNLWGYARDIYQQPGIADTVRFDHIKNHYYGSHPTINPTRIVPLGPDIDFNAPHDREKLSTSAG